MKLDKVEAHCTDVLEAVHARQFGNGGREVLEWLAGNIGRDHRVVAPIEGQHDVLDGEAFYGAQQPARPGRQRGLG